MNATLRSVLGVAGLVVAAHATAEITFYQRDGFDGRSFTTDRQVRNFEHHGSVRPSSVAGSSANRWCRAT